MAIPELGCAAGPGMGLASAQALRVHFQHRHPQDLVRADGSLLPQSRLCGLQTWGAGSSCHEATAQCKDLAARRAQHAAANNGLLALKERFTAYRKDLKRV